MSRSASSSSRAADESGAVLVMFALFAPVAILLVAFVIDIGYSWLHQRHLQVQADAAALAGAQGFQPCANSTISSGAQQYGGVSGSPVYNLQIGGTRVGGIHQLINSTTFYGQNTPVDGTVSTAAPCSAMMVDVKMTETNLPWWFGGFRSILQQLPYINAQARVSILQVSTATGSLPVAINDNNPKYAEAYFVNQASGSVLGAVPLTTSGSSGGLSTWSSVANPYSLTVPSGTTSDVGVRIALSGSAHLTGNMTTDCAAASVLCYDASTGTAQMADVHGWSATGTGTLTAPLSRGVTLTPGTCGDPYYTSTFYTSATTCTDGVQASIDFGASPNLSGVTVKASGTTLACTYNATTKLVGCTGNLPVTAGSGRTQFDVTYTGGSGKNKFSGSFGNAQSTYAAAVNGNAGPIQTLGLSEAGVGDTSSLKQGTTHSLVVNMGVTGSLSVAQSTSDPIYTMRFTGTGSQNQSVACNAANGGSTYADALASGCSGSYGINSRLTCPDTLTPIDCLSPATGNKQNQVAKGLNLRILGSSKPSACTAPNHWSSFPNLAASDPRIVSVFVTPYGSFGSSGASSSFPIENFASFYITGWQDSGAGFNNPCQGNGDDTAAAGTIVGHFIKYINTLNTGQTGNGTCSLTALGLCVAVLTR